MKRKAKKHTISNAEQLVAGLEDAKAPADLLMI